MVTLIGAAGARCFGVAYRVAAAEAEAVLVALDHRERAGYQRIPTSFYCGDDEQSLAQVLVYIASSSNPDYLGPAPLEDIAARICRAHGPSGSNRDYVLRLAAALAAIGGDDEHVSAVARLVAHR